MGNWQELCTFVPNYAKNNLHFQHVSNLWLNVWPPMSMIGCFCRFWHKCAQFLSIFHRNYHSLSAKLAKTLLDSSNSKKTSFQVLFWAVRPAPILWDWSQAGIVGHKKRVLGLSARVGRGWQTVFLVNLMVFYRKNASRANAPFQIEAIINESSCFSNCFYLKRTWLPVGLTLLLFEKNPEYLL